MKCTAMRAGQQKYKGQREPHHGKSMTECSHRSDGWGAPFGRPMWNLVPWWNEGWIMQSLVNMDMTGRPTTVNNKGWKIPERKDDRWHIHIEPSKAGIEGKKANHGRWWHFQKCPSSRHVRCETSAIFGTVWMLVCNMTQIHCKCQWKNGSVTNSVYWVQREIFKGCGVAGPSKFEFSM